MFHIRILLALAVLCSVASAQIRAFGTSCNGHLPSAPSMSASAPLVTGSKFDLKIDAVAKSTSFLFVIGASNRTWSGVPLPFDAGLIGFPGCFLNVAFNKVRGLTSDSNGQLALPIDLAAIPAGLRLYVQIVVPEPSGTKIAASQGYELEVQKSVKPFLLVTIPDTQFYVASPTSTLQFNKMTKWIVDNQVARNAVFVSCVGDTVSQGATGPNNNKTEWDRANAAITLLDGNLATNPDGVIPYSMAVGNRDLDTKNIKATANQFLSYFGPSRYSTRNWWGGTGPNSVNTYQIFNVGGKKFLHVSLEWRPRDTVITWARKILTANPELPTILTTHQYLGFGPQGFDNMGTTPDSIGDNGGLDLRHKLVEPFPQIFFANCGHNTGGNHRSTNTILGQRVHEIMADYSLDPDGGNGWMNLLEYQPDKGRIINSCFSSTYKPGITTGPDRSIDPKNNATFDYAFHTHRRTLEETRALRFTGRHDNGHGAYSGALDTFVWSKSATTSHGSFTDIQVEDESSSDKHQGLIKFGGIFGTTAGQIPTNRRIVRAILTLTTEGTFATSVNVSRLYQLKVPFDESSTWKSLNNGIQIGTETVATAVVSTGNLVSTKGTRSFDVTATLRAWQAGDKNHGWAIVNDGADTWTFRSQEWSAPAERPMLTVIYER